MSERAQIQFPVEFAIKVMGRKDSDVRRASREIIERHAGALSEERIRERASGERNYLALTFVIEASSREQLDAIYRELTACAEVLMAL